MVTNTEVNSKKKKDLNSENSEKMFHIVIACNENPNLLQINEICCTAKTGAYSYRTPCTYIHPIFVNFLQ